MNYRQQIDRISGHLGKITQLYHECAKLHGLTYNTMLVLGALRYYQSCTQKQIAEACGLPKQSVNTIVKDFQNKGYVELLAGNNKKEKLVTLTPAGQVFSDTVLEPRIAIEERVLQQIGETQCQQLSDILEQFADNFQKEVVQLQNTKNNERNI